MRKNDTSIRELIDGIKNKLQINYSWIFYLYIFSYFKKLYFCCVLGVFVLLVTC
jgi:hypothetical protein